AARGDEARPPLVPGEPAAPAAPLHRGPVRRPPGALPERRAVVHVGPPLVRVPHAQHGGGARDRAPGARVLPPRGEPVPRVADLATRLGALAAGGDRDDPLPPQDPERRPDRAQATQRAGLRGRPPAVARRAPRDTPLEPARSHPHGVPQPVRPAEPRRAHGGLGLAGPGGYHHQLPGGGPAPRRPLRECAAPRLARPLALTRAEPPGGARGAPRAGARRGAGEPDGTGAPHPARGSRPDRRHPPARLGAARARAGRPVGSPG